MLQYHGHAVFCYHNNACDAHTQEKKKFVLLMRQLRFQVEINPAWMEHWGLSVELARKSAGDLWRQAHTAHGLVTSGRKPAWLRTVVLRIFLSPLITLVLFRLLRKAAAVCLSAHRSSLCRPPPLFHFYLFLLSSSLHTFEFRMTFWRGQQFGSGPVGLGQIQDSGYCSVM